MSLNSRIVSLDDNAGGGFVPRKRLGGDKRRRKASSHHTVVDPADLEVARQRWSGNTPMAVAREIAADLSDLGADLMVQLGPLEPGILEVVVGELCQLEPADLRSAITTGVLATRITELKSEAKDIASAVA